MKVVYHGVPEGMVGQVLHPLNRLREVDETAHAQQRAKYEGRESLLELRIPALGLLWNDVVHCAPIHPRLLFAARRALGVPATGRTTGRFFAIPLERILDKPVLWATQDASRAVAFEPFDADRYRELDAVPAEHLDYLRRAAESGRRALTFGFVPHVLVAGPIDISGVAVVTCDSPTDTGPAADTASGREAPGNARRRG